MIILFDGPEKVGKTTILNKLEARLTCDGYNVLRWKWGPVSPDDRVYKPVLAEHVNRSDAVVLWDRAWPSEHVYGKMLGRDRRLVDDPWLGEWLHRRALAGRGQSIILLPSDPRMLYESRDETDLPVDPVGETAEFAAYAQRFHYDTYWCDHTDRNDDWIIARIVQRMKLVPNTNLKRYAADDITGPVASKLNVNRVVVVGDRISENPGIPGAWLPFTSRYTTRFARLFGDAALAVTWTNAHPYFPGLFTWAQTVVACGKQAQAVVAETKWKDQTVINVPHPAWIYRWNSAEMKKAAASMEEALQPAIEQAWEDWNNATPKND